jgi:hypothetical protein
MSGWLTNGITPVTPATYTGLGMGSAQYPVDSEAAAGASPQSGAFPVSAGSQGLFATVTAAGATQGNATALTAFKNLITVALTASTKGVKLPTPVTGLEVLVANGATFGVKIWPSSGAQIGAAATNAVGPVLAINKAIRFLAVSATKWVSLAGA